EKALVVRAFFITRGLLGMKLLLPAADREQGGDRYHEEQQCKVRDAQVEQAHREWLCGAVGADLRVKAVGLDQEPAAEADGRGRVEPARVRRQGQGRGDHRVRVEQ